MADISLEPNINAQPEKQAVVSIKSVNALPEPPPPLVHLALSGEYPSNHISTKTDYTHLTAEALSITTDADVYVHNDTQTTLNVQVTNNSMGNKYPSCSIPRGQTQQGHVSSGFSISASYYDLSFNGDHSIQTYINSDNTSLNPDHFLDGKVGCLLAPGKPFIPGTNYEFHYFNGPNIIPTLFNGFIEANLPAMQDFINKNGLNTHSGNFKMTLIQFDLDPKDLYCSYSGVSKQEHGSWSLSVMMRVDTATIGANIDYSGFGGPITLSVSQLVLFLNLRINTSSPYTAEVKTLKCSLGDYSASGSALFDILKMVFARIYVIMEAAGASLLSASRLAGIINTYANDQIKTKINELIKDASKGTAQFASRVPEQFAGETNRARTQDIELSQWMSNPGIQSRLLRELHIPGTHDSGAYSLTHRLSNVPYSDIKFLWNLRPASAPVNGHNPFPTSLATDGILYVGPGLYNFIISPVASSISQAGDQSIFQQLQGGIRWFDIRLELDVDGIYYLQHGLRGPAFDDILAQVQSFPDNKPKATELVFLNVSHANFSQDRVEQVTEKVTNPFMPSQMYYRPA